MNAQPVYIKTDAGRDEIKTRSRHLPASLRTVLLLVDGNRDAAQLSEMALASKATPDSLDQLLNMGLIAPLGQGIVVQAESNAAIVPPPAKPAAEQETLEKVQLFPMQLASASNVSPAGPNEPAENFRQMTEVERFNRLYAYMTTVVHDHLGLPRAYFMQLKIERSNSIPELLAIREDLRGAITKLQGPAIATSVIEKINHMASVSV